MTQDEFAYGVHALSHAICNVSPMFVPCGKFTLYSFCCYLILSGYLNPVSLQSHTPLLVINDVQCDHAIYKPTRVVIFDARAGGSGIVAQLWQHVFKPDGIIQAAIDLLDTCSSCSDDRGYTGGCPACIQVGECIKFNDFLCKKSALVIARHMLSRIESTDLYKKNESAGQNNSEGENDDDDNDSTERPRKRTLPKEVTSPRRK